MRVGSREVERESIPHEKGCACLFSARKYGDQQLFMNLYLVATKRNLEGGDDLRKAAIWTTRALLLEWLTKCSQLCLSCRCLSCSSSKTLASVDGNTCCVAQLFFSVSFTNQSGFYLVVPYNNNKFHRRAFSCIFLYLLSLYSEATRFGNGLRALGCWPPFFSPPPCCSSHLADKKEPERPHWPRNLQPNGIPI